MPVLGHFFCSADSADSVRQRMQNKVLQRYEHSGKAWGPVGEEQFPPLAEKSHKEERNDHYYGLYQIC